MAHCRQCQATIAQNVKFCPQCGAQSPLTLFCSGCGKGVSASDSFCGDCGSPVGSPQPVAARQVVQPAKGGIESPLHAKKLSRWWPESGWGNLLYFVVIGGGAVMGFSLANQEAMDAEMGMVQRLALSGCLAFAALVILTIWRNLLINYGAISREEVVVDATGQQTKSGGVSWWGVVLVFIGIGVARYAADNAKRNFNRQRPPVKFHESNRPRLAPIRQPQRDPSESTGFEARDRFRN